MHLRPWTALVALIALAGCVAPPPGSMDAAVWNYPDLIVGGNVRPTDGSGPFPLSCPAAGARVEQKGGPTFEFLGASPTSPDLCRMRIGGQLVEGWYGIWLTDWPGAEAAYPALNQVIHGPTGSIAAFDTHMAAGLQWHDLIRNEGVEDITLLGTTYHAMKISHYREGFDGNGYSSVSTIWKDIPTGLLIYGTYQHISGQPEIDDPLLPTAILPAPVGATVR